MEYMEYLLQLVSTLCAIGFGYFTGRYHEILKKEKEREMAKNDM